MKLKNFKELSYERHHIFWSSLIHRLKSMCSWPVCFQRSNHSLSNVEWSNTVGLSKSNKARRVLWQIWLHPTVLIQRYIYIMFSNCAINIFNYHWWNVLGYTLQNQFQELSQRHCKMQVLVNRIIVHHSILPVLSQNNLQLRIGWDLGW